jgi:probable F420-dependent oxidoreductase
LHFDTFAFGTDLRGVGRLASDASRAGFATMWFTESSHNPFLPCAVAAEVAPALGVGTSVAIAFPRSPMVTAQEAWDLAAQTGGNFQLGLGTQVRAHITRRFSTPWSKPVAQLREYVAALRAIFQAFQGTAPLKFSGDYYSFSLLTDFFSGGPIEHPDVPVQIAGVNTGLARLAGEVCDGFHIHPFHSREYITDVIRPAVAQGAVRAGRSVDQVAMICPTFIVVGDSEAERAPQRDAVRSQLSFYASTPTYQPVLEHHGFGEAGPELQQLVRNGDRAAMAAVMTDEVIAPYYVEAGWSELADTLHARYDGVADRLISYLSVGSWAESPELFDRWSDVVRAFNAR